jgi:hypothetical protein
MASNGQKKPFRIATVATFDYFPFLLVFLGSLYKNVDLEKISNIEILIDTCPDELVSYLEQFEKVHLTRLAESHSFSGTHSKGWQSAVSEKLLFCKNLLTKSDEPVLLIDSDILFVKDLPDLSSGGHDIVFTLIQNEQERHTRRDGLRIDFIGSAVYFSNAPSSLEFIRLWQAKMRELIQEGYRPPYETPALNLLLQEEIEKKNSSYGFMPDDLIAADQKCTSETAAIHLKSWGPSKETPMSNFLSRSSRQSWSSHLLPANYIDYLAYELWITKQLEEKIPEDFELAEAVSL